MQIKGTKMNFAEAEIEFTIPLKQLVEQGFLRKKQNIKLLKRSNGNYELVLKFLEAKRNLELVSKKGPKIPKDKKDKKKDKKSHRKSSSSEDEEKLADSISDLKMTEDNQAWPAKGTESKHKDKKNKREFSPEKLAMKEEKKALKILQKEEKKRSKEAFKLSRKIEKKAKKAEEPAVLPDKITKVYLDGNNMVYVLGALRSKAIHRSGFPVAEKILSAMAQEWAKASSFANVTVILDNSDLKVQEDKFTVTSARPAFNTSDDALIHWAKNAREEDNATTAVFTSDRGLTDELVKCGVRVLKSKAWFAIASQVLTVANHDGPFADLDMWADAWLASKNFNF